LKQLRNCITNDY